MSEGHCGSASAQVRDLGAETPVQSSCGLINVPKSRLGRERAGLDHNCCDEATLTNLGPLPSYRSDATADKGNFEFGDDEEFGLKRFSGLPTREGGARQQSPGPPAAPADREFQVARSPVLARDLPGFANCCQSSSKILANLRRLVCTTDPYSGHNPF
ncbi:hypothetical protein VTK26DRAFT_4940 [Humicola hyalothermophila]